MFYLEKFPRARFSNVICREAHQERLTWRIPPTPGLLESLGNWHPTGKPMCLGALRSDQHAAASSLAKNLFLIEADASAVIATETVEPLDSWLPRRRMHDKLPALDTWFIRQFPWCDLGTAAPVLQGVKGRKGGPLSCVQDGESDWECARRLLQLVSVRLRQPLVFLGDRGGWRAASLLQSAVSQRNWAVSGYPRLPSRPSQPLVGQVRFARTWPALDLAVWEQERMAERPPLLVGNGYRAIAREDHFAEVGAAWTTYLDALPSNNAPQQRDAPPAIWDSLTGPPESVLLAIWTQAFGSPSRATHWLQGRVTDYNPARWELTCKFDDFEAGYDQAQVQVATLDAGADGKTGWNIVPHNGSRIVVQCDDLSPERPCDSTHPRDWAEPGNPQAERKPNVLLQEELLIKSGENAASLTISSQAIELASSQGRRIMVSNEIRHQ